MTNDTKAVAEDTTATAAKAMKAAGANRAKSERPAKPAKATKAGPTNAKAVPGKAKDAKPSATGVTKGEAKTAKLKKSKAKRMSAIDAAATVLASAKEPMRAADLVKVMAERGLWTSPGGKTPEATLYAAMLREISTRKSESRFRKVERGLFAAGGH